MADTTNKKHDEPQGVNVKIPGRVHRLMRIAIAARGDCTWTDAATEAFEAWARANMPKEVR